MGLLLAHEVSSQCCSAGNPVGGTSNVGTVPKGTLRASSFFRHSFSDTYYTGSEKSELQGTKANFNYLGFVGAYGIVPRLTVEAELGIYLNKTRTSDIFPKENAWGLSNAVTSLKYAIWKDKVREWEVTAGAGVRFPFTRELKYAEAGYPLSVDVQPSTGATGFVGQVFLYKGFLPKGWRLFMLERFETNAVNDIGYQFGKANYLSMFISRNINVHWTGILQFRYEWRSQDHREDILMASTGGNVVYAAPQVNLKIAQKWNLSILAEMPIIRNYNLAQLGTKYALSISVMREFDLSKKDKSLIPN
ncbi:MAG: hypothetical protein IPL92_18175 [Saprospiraceae bacterium]|nr:hypothetical protein [Candidatus Opimibacter iunctus]